MTATVAAPQRARTGPVLAVVLVSYLMIVLDISIVITALPRIHTGLGFSAADPDTLPSGDDEPIGVREDVARLAAR